MNREWQLLFPYRCPRGRLANQGLVGLDERLPEEVIASRRDGCMIGTKPESRVFGSRRTRRIELASLSRRTERGEIASGFVPVIALMSILGLDSSWYQAGHSWNTEIQTREIPSSATSTPPFSDRFTSQVRMTHYCQSTLHPGIATHPPRGASTG